MKNKNFKEFYNRRLIVEAEPTSVTDTKTQNPGDVKNATSIGGMFKNAAKKAGMSALKGVGNAIRNELHPNLQKAVDKTIGGVKAVAKDIKAIATRLKDINFPKKIYQAAFDKNVDELNNLLLEFPGNTKLGVDYKALSNNEVFKQIPVFFPAIDGLVKAKVGDTSVIEKFATKYKDITALLSQSFKWKTNIKTVVPLENAKQNMGSTVMVKNAAGIYDLDIVSFAIVLKASAPFIEALLKTCKKFKVDIKTLTFNIVQVLLLNENFELFYTLYTKKVLEFNNSTQALIDTLVKYKTDTIPATTLKIFEEIIKDFKPGADEGVLTKISFPLLGFKIDLNKIDWAEFKYDPTKTEEQSIPRNLIDALYYTLLCKLDPELTKQDLLYRIAKYDNNEVLNNVKDIIKRVDKTYSDNIKIINPLKENRQNLSFESLGFDIDLNKPDFSKFNYDPAKPEVQIIPKKLARALFYVLLCLQEPNWAREELQKQKIDEISAWNTPELLKALIYRLNKNTNPKCSPNIKIGR